MKNSSSSIIDTENLFDDLDGGLLILTPNHRSNIQIIEAYGEYRRKHALPLVCPSPAIFPVDIWLRQCADNLFASPNLSFPSQTILTTFQELFLWKSIIRESDIGGALLNLEGTASSAIEAYRTIKQWEIPLREIENLAAINLVNTDILDDVSVFLSWFATYEKQTKKSGLASLSQVLIQVVDTIEQGLIQLPNQIILLGFDSPPPLYERLFKALAQSNSQLDCHHLAPAFPLIEVKALNDTAHEIRQSAHWAQKVLENESEARIGIICPDLHARRSEINRSYLNTFYPDNIVESAAIKNPIFSTTAIEKLDSAPLIQAILNSLKVNEKNLPTLEVCQILRSQFFVGEEEESSARAELELKLRKGAELNCQLSNLRYLALDQEGKTWHCPILGKALLAIETLRRQHKGLNTIKHWSEVIEQQITLCIDLESLQESNELLQWYELLSEFKTLTLLTKSISLSAAINLLIQLARSINANTFLNQAPIQILSPIEASGLKFTHIWCMGLSENNWPIRARSNPFIPILLQNKYKLPAANAELQYQAAKALLKQYAQGSSETLIFSYPSQVDGIALEPSMLLQELTNTSFEKLEEKALNPDLHSFSQTLIQMAKAKNQIEILEDTLNIPLLENEQARGGTALIADQASCPFKSFAKHRLNAPELPSIAYGLPAFAVGNMVHHVMELFWEEIKSLSQINDMPADQLKQKILIAATAGVKKANQRYPSIMTSRYCELEIHRLTGLLNLWLDEERQRGNFTILEHEYALQWQHSNLTLDFRIDRIERFEDQSIGLVDYKTSRAKAIDWFDPRPENPQLMLYLQAAELEGHYKPVSSVLLAHINIDDMKYVGLSETAASHPKTALESNRAKPDEMSWEALKASWGLSLEALAQEFLEGYVAITPKTLNSCQYCHLPALCRIQEKGPSV